MSLEHDNSQNAYERRLLKWVNKFTTLVLAVEIIPALPRPVGLVAAGVLLGAMFSGSEEGPNPDDGLRISSHEAIVESFEYRQAA